MSYEEKDGQIVSLDDSCIIGVTSARAGRLYQDSFWDFVDERERTAEQMSSIRQCK